MTSRRSVLLVILIFLANAGLLLVREQQVTGDPWNFPVDDAWIHMTFARNLAFGLGFGVNPGEPVAASTSVSWALWLAVLHRAVAGFGMRAVVFAVKGSGVLLAVVAIIGAMRLLKRFIDDDTDRAVAGLLLIFSYPLAWGALSGMEVALCAACAIWALDYQVSACGDSPGPRDREISIACWSLAFLARPENVLLLGLALLIFLAHERESRLRLAGRLLLIAGLCVVPFVLFHAEIAGQPFPHTFTSKMTPRALPRAIVEMPAAEAMRAVAGSVLDHLRVGVEFLLLESPFVGLLYLAAPFLAWKTGFGRSAPPALSAGMAMAWIALPLLAVSVGILTGSMYYTVHHGRYIPQTILMAAFCGIAGFHRFWNATGRSRWIVLPLLFSLVFALDRQVELAEDHARECDIIRRIHVSLGKWLNELPKGLTVALNDIGGMAYFGGQRIIDLEGLASPETNSWRRQGRIDLFLERVKPDLLIIFPGWFPEIASRPEIFRPIFIRTVEENITGGGNVKAVYRMPWSRGLPDPWPALPPSGLPTDVPVPPLPERHE
ncbi:MAG TPA: hypothetical protein PLU72_11925 [Candidatus Ozemobacteraceae bacterium]|nr:hypothetical protein [Candidatus Ozemobacteraceae bacterium]